MAAQVVATEANLLFTGFRGALTVAGYDPLAP